ncbi:zona pellucida sperm-binding protein 4-like [Carcharodon carcharias]|uniref:zona pellucida sperm-binding protein 4-like n=1 Tax=Carcharodon carcharias TaxID=13397 RepID=UPI001B7E209A|nr:zona pellucida sperm-binding protein 4-like [Carcharodon carcharias]
MGCCFDAGSRDVPPCFYSLDNLPACTKDGRVLIAISKDLTLPPVNLTTVHLKDGHGAECSPIVVSVDTVLFQFAVTECGTTQRVYFHCRAEVCHPSIRENCTAPCSPKRRRSADDQSGALVTAEGSIIFLGDEERLAVGMEQEEKDAAVDSPSHVVPGLAVGVALLSVTLLVGTVAVWKMDVTDRLGTECSSMEL